MLRIIKGLLQFLTNKNPWPNAIYNLVCGRETICNCFSQLRLLITRYHKVGGLPITEISNGQRSGVRD